MNNNFYLKIYRLIIGVIILIAITTQLLTFRQTPSNFLSYFTVLSNFLVSFVLIVQSLDIPQIKTMNTIRGAATLYILITGLGFTILLGGKNTEFLSWVNITLHYISPLAMTLDWFFTPSEKIPFKKALTWILFLFIYLAYTLILGHITSWYPYGFLNPGEIGYNGIFLYICVLIISSLFISFIITTFSGRKNK
ncbi:Pr6Pr family membrane protein [Candidatus Gottesmanbacteria bacterium]|nr:Pr6Pr family membrane protein [Candidatus Gottesmanbacteria bacterium]